jgi:glucose/galactose transporter
MAQNNTKQGYTTALLLIGSLFFIFGFITWSNSQLIPYLKIACELTPSESYLVATAFFAAYFFMALPSSYILGKTGYKKGMSLGLFVMAAGALIFIPAATSRSYPLFLTGLFVIGTGLALLQTASNPYVAILGPHESAARRISIMGICNKVAGITAVYVFGKITLSNADELIEKLKHLGAAEKTAELDALAHKVILPYGLIAAALALLGLAMLFVHLPDLHSGADTDAEEAKVETALAAGKTSVLQFPHAILGAIAIFFYVGAEVISYDTFAGFGQQLGYPLATAKSFASYTGYALLLGYVVGIATMPKLISQQKALVLSCGLSLIFTFTAMMSSGDYAIFVFAALGFSNAVMWPAIFPLALNGLGRFTSAGAALLIMGIAGGAILPPLYGKLGEALGNMQEAYAILIPCYLYILYFAVSGHNAGMPKEVRGRG